MELLSRTIEHRVDGISFHWMRKFAKQTSPYLDWVERDIVDYIIDMLGDMYNE